MEADKSDGPPRLSHLRGSGSLEQDGDVVLFVYKNHQFDHGAYNVIEKKHTATWVEVAKNKNGECGGLPFWFHRPYFKLTEAADDWSDAGRYAEVEAVPA